MSKHYTTDQARQDYTPKLRRAALIEMGGRFGLSTTTMRKLIEGEKAPLKGHKYEGDATQYFDRDEALQLVTGNQALSRA